MKLPCDRGLTKISEEDSRNRANQIPSSNNKTLGILLLLTAGSILVQGYHPYAEDAEIYLPGVERILHPELFPVDREFFASHASLTLFPNLIAFSIRATHLPMEWALFLWQIASIFLLLLACWELGSLCFPSATARWCGVCLVAALLTLPVAGTALYIMDQYLNPRNLAAFAGIFMVVRTLETKYVRAGLWLVFAACMHPMMWAFPFSFCILLVAMERLKKSWSKPAAIVSLALLWMPLAPATSTAYHEAAKKHGFHYIQHWAWYELLGIVAPLVLFWWFAQIARRQQAEARKPKPEARRALPMAERVSRAFVIYGLIYTAVALIVDLPARFESLARLQPLRSLHFLYIVMLVLIGGFAGEYLLKNRLWRWLALFVPLCAGMLVAQRALFPTSSHIEFPGVTPKNPWAQAFLWIQQNTPVDALFALDPDYMHIPGEDNLGFRCLAQRSRLADAVKDNGVVSMFPPLAEAWWAQVQAQTPWKNFRKEDFAELRKQYGVTWLVVQQPGVDGIECGYQNDAVRVCRLP